MNPAFINTIMAPNLEIKKKHLGYEKAHTHPKSNHLLMSRGLRGKSI